MSRNTRTRNRRRSQTKNPIQVMRGLVIETLGVAALAFLYFTMQASSASEKAAIRGNNDLIDDSRQLESGTFPPDASIKSVLKPGFLWPQKLNEFPIWTSVSSNR